VGEIDNEQMREEVRELSGDIVKRRRLNLPKETRSRLLEELQHEVFGLGPLEGLMDDPTISDILVNGPGEVYIERLGRLEPTGIVFADDRHVMRIVQRVVAKVNRRIDEVSPMVDARLPDGSRINAVIPPVALDGPKLSIRRFGGGSVTREALLANC